MKAQKTTVLEAIQKDIDSLLSKPLESNRKELQHAEELLARCEKCLDDIERMRMDVARIK